MGQVKKFEAELLAPVARRGAGVAREKLEMHRHNSAILAEASRLNPAVPFADPVEDCTQDLLEREHAAPPAGATDSWD